MVVVQHRETFSLRDRGNDEIRDFAAAMPSLGERALGEQGTVEVARSRPGRLR